MTSVTDPPADPLLASASPWPASGRRGHEKGQIRRKAETQSFRANGIGRFPRQLSHSATGVRTEIAWKSTGGGVSTLVVTPAWQQSLTYPGRLPGHRSTADLSFNADPNTGQYVAFTAPGATQRGWYAFGGTSLATPQIAGLLITNAHRASRGLAPLGNTAPTLYTRFAPRSSAWSTAFNDVASGRNGICEACVSATGYDVPTGLGTPRADYFLPALAGS